MIMQLCVYCRCETEHRLVVLSKDERTGKTISAFRCTGEGETHNPPCECERSAQKVNARKDD